MKRSYLYLALICIVFAVFWWIQRTPTTLQQSSSSIDNSSSVNRAPVSARLPGSVPPARDSKSNDIVSEKDFRERFKGEWQFLRHGEKVHSIIGGKISGYESSPEGATRFAKELAHFFGVDAEHLDGGQISAVSTPLRQVYHISQTVDGVPVYQSSIAVFFSKNSGDIVLLNSELQSFSQQLEGPQISAQQATNSIESNRDWEGARVTNIQGVVLYVKDKVAIPSYVLTAVAGEKKKETWEVVVNGVNGEILHRHARNPDEDKDVH